MIIRASDSSIYAMSASNAPAASVPSGSNLEFETLDCFAGQLQKPEDRLDAVDWNHVNPATGPVYIEGAEAGDTLKVTIEDIRFGPMGVMAAGGGMGETAKRLGEMRNTLMAIEDGVISFSDKVKIPLRPMIGVIGVAPADGQSIACGSPGFHGGNMDNTMVTIGSILYFPVFVPGALLAMGDLHAAMGDGEICGTGVEAPRVVRVKVEVLKNKPITSPVLETETQFTTIGSCLDLHDAATLATNDMADLICARTGMDLYEASMLLSACGDLQICQVVDPLMTARMCMPKFILRQIGFEF